MGIVNFDAHVYLLGTLLYPSGMVGCVCYLLSYTR
jgi:hypothetical protein